MSDNQNQLFDTSVKELNPDWIDPNQPLKIPNNPLHYKAWRLQIILETLNKQAAGRAAQQFNPTAFLAMLNEYTRVVTLIIAGKKVDDGKDEEDANDELESLADDNARRVAQVTSGGSASALGDEASAGLDPGVSSDDSSPWPGLPPLFPVSIPEGVSDGEGPVPDNQQAAPVRD